MVKIKICGITNLEDALLAADAGADALGFVFHAPSPRNISPDQAAAIINRLPPFIQTVGLFVNQTPETINKTADDCGLDIIQLHGEEPPEFGCLINRRVIKAIRVKAASSLEQIDSYRAAAIVLDAWSASAHGGTGQTFNWELAAAAAKSCRIILAGGLTSGSIAAAIHQVRPYGVDVSSGVESAPGRKDRGMLLAFIENARLASGYPARYAPQPGNTL